MTFVEWIKLLIVIPMFFGLGPLLGVYLRDKPGAQRWVFAAMCFMTINGLFGPGNWGLTLDSVETYRGHAKGYHFYFNNFLAIGLVVAKRLESRELFRWFPPGGILYVLMVVICTISIVNAPRVDYVLMAAHKMVIFYLIFQAAFNWMRTRAEIEFFFTVMAITMCWQVCLVLKLKYLDGIYQARGTFEHQNPLAMYAVMIAMPLLAVGIGPAFRGRAWCIAGFLSSGIIVQSALSRASLLMFAIGTLGVVILSLLEKPTKRRFVMTGSLALVGSLGLVFTLDTIISRFNDHGNQASGELREVLNEAARQMEADYPLGIGWNNYALCVNEPYPYAEVLWERTRGRGHKVDKSKKNPPVESHYYLLIGENGYPGLFAWLLVIGAGLWRNVLAFWSFQHSVERCVSIGIFVGCSMNYVQSLLERVLTQPRNLMLWLILYAVTARLALLRREKGSNAVLSEPEETGILESPASDPKVGKNLLPLAPLGINKPYENKNHGKVNEEWSTPDWARDDQES
jgi:hypothetical protein